MVCVLESVFKCVLGVCVQVCVGSVCASVCWECAFKCVLGVCVQVCVGEQDIQKGQEESKRRADETIKQTVHKSI